MVCRKCGNEWETDQRVSASLLACPFCGASLAEKEVPVFFDKSKDALCFIATRYGVEALLSERIVNLFPDIAPELKEEKELIKVLQTSGALIVLKSNLHSSANDQELAVRQAIVKLPSYMDKVMVESIIREFTIALGWQLHASAQQRQLTQQQSRQQSTSSPKKNTKPSPKTFGKQPQSNNPTVSSGKPKNKSYTMIVASVIGFLIFAIVILITQSNNANTSNTFVAISGITQTSAPNLTNTYISQVMPAPKSRALTLRELLSVSHMPVSITGSFPTGKRYEVYSGPGTNYVRGASGKALVSTNDWIGVLGIDQGWTLIQYKTNSSKWRRGYIQGEWDTRSVPNANVTAVSKNTVSITDDPVMSHDKLKSLPANTPVTILGLDGDWAYVEYSNTRGYVLLSDLEIN